MGLSRTKWVLDEEGNRGSRCIVNPDGNSFFGAKIRIWGTQSFDESGIVDFIKQELFGGNVGHASVELRALA